MKKWCQQITRLHVNPVSAGWRRHSKGRCGEPVLINDDNVLTLGVSDDAACALGTVSFEDNRAGLRALCFSL